MGLYTFLFILLNCIFKLQQDLRYVSCTRSFLVGWPLELLLLWISVLSITRAMHFRTSFSLCHHDNMLIFSLDLSFVLLYWQNVLNRGSTSLSISTNFVSFVGYHLLLDVVIRFLCILVNFPFCTCLALKVYYEMI